MDAADVRETAAWVARRGFRRVALQFPDEFLADAVPSTTALQAACGSAVTVFLLADTTFGSCCVDEVAAQHADADCVVHFGRSCLSPVSQLPSRLVFAKQAVDVAHLAALLADHAARCGSRAVVVLLDQECAHTAAALQAAALDASREAPGAAFVFGDAPPTELEPACVAAHGFGDEPAELPGPQAAPAADAPAAAHSSCADCACGITWQLPPGVALTDCSIVWVGGANAALLRLLMSLPLLPDGSTVPCARYDPAARVLEASASQTQEAQRVLKRRYYLVERAKQASIVGLVAGTLGVAGFRAALERVRALAEAAGKKTYTFLVGKPNPAKLANFPEVDVFVLVACPQTALLDSREFLAPIVTVFEAELAFTPGAAWAPGEYRTAFADLPAAAAPALQGRDGGGEAASASGEEEDDASEDRAADAQTSSALTVHGDRTLRATGGRGVAEVTTAAQFLTLRRTFQGLEPTVREGGDVALQAAAGQSGRAAEYSGEGAA